MTGIITELIHEENGGWSSPQLQVTSYAQSI